MLMPVGTAQGARPAQHLFATDGEYLGAGSPTVQASGHARARQVLARLMRKSNA
jgi:hypothetical protein